MNKNQIYSSEEAKIKLLCIAKLLSSENKILLHAVKKFENQ